MIDERVYALASLLSKFRDGESHPEFPKAVLLAALRVNVNPKEVYAAAARMMPPGVELPNYTEIAPAKQ